MEPEATVKPAYDLLGVFALCSVYLIAVLTLPGGLLQALLGLPFLLVLPGYVLLAGIDSGSVRWALSERLALSCVLSLAIVVFAAMSLNAFRRLDLAGLLCTLEAIIAASCAYAYQRKTRGLPGNSDRTARSPLRWQNRSGPTMLIDVVVVACVCTLLCLVADTIVYERRPVPTTAFYLLGKEGKAGSYVETVECGCRFPVTLGVINNEQDVKHYSIRMRIGDQRPRILAQITLEPSQSWEERFEVAIDQCGTLQPVVFDLLEGQSESPYRTVYQRIRATLSDEGGNVCGEAQGATYQVGTNN